MHSKRVRPCPFTHSPVPCKIRRSRPQKKTVKFSPYANQRRFATSDDLSYSSWLTADELVSMSRRAKTLSLIHYTKTRAGQPKTSNRSGIVCNCHPAHYEIIGESLRGMELYTDIFSACKRKRLRFDSITLVRENQALLTSCKLASLYQEHTKEAMLNARNIAEEDANIAAAILAEDLKQDDNGLASLLSSSISSAAPTPSP